MCFSQTDSCSLRISLLTCAPGEELYASFGHTALRVTDSANRTDLVFNYGTFEFSADFEMKFIRGKLLYSLSVESFPDFLYEYQIESRSVQEQVLQLNCTEKIRLRQAELRLAELTAQRMRQKLTWSERNEQEFIKQKKKINELKERLQELDRRLQP